MEDRKIEIVMNLEKYVIGLDDTFAFTCRSCGACCRQREDILLTAKDLFRIAVKLELTMKQTIEKYCDVYIGHNSRIPIVRLQPIGALNVCPLLHKNRCIIHDAKPVVCALFPLGRVLKYGNLQTGDMFEKEQLIYIINDFTCGGRRKKQTVRAWLEQFGIPVKDEYFFLWNKVINNLSTAVRDIKNADASEKTLEMVMGGIFTVLYTNYDTKKEFRPQFEANAKILLNIHVK